MGDTIYLSSGRFHGGVLAPVQKHDADEVFLSYYSGDRLFEGRPIKEYDANSDSYISFDEMGRDPLKFVLLGHNSAVDYHVGKSLEVIKLARKIEAEKLSEREPIFRGGKI